MTAHLAFEETWAQKAYDSLGNVVRQRDITFLWARRGREFVNESVISYITFVASMSGDIQQSLYYTMVDLKEQIRLTLRQMNSARTPYEVLVVADRLTKRLEWMNALEDAQSNISPT